MVIWPGACEGERTGKACLPCCESTRTYPRKPGTRGPGAEVCISSCCQWRKTHQQNATSTNGEWPCWNQLQRFDPIVCLFLLTLQTRCRWSSKNNTQPKGRLIYESDIILHFKKDPVWSEMNRLLARHYQDSCCHLSVGSSWPVTSCEPQSGIREWGFLYKLLA